MIISKCIHTHTHSQQHKETSVDKYMYKQERERGERERGERERGEREREEEREEEREGKEGEREREGRREGESNPDTIINVYDNSTLHTHFTFSLFLKWTTFIFQFRTQTNFNPQTNNIIVHQMSGR